MRIQPRGRSVRRLSRFVQVSLMLATVCVLACLSAQSGVRPRTDQLSSLNVGVSTKTEVRAALGEPNGNGAVRFSPVTRRREVWFYDYAKSGWLGTHFVVLGVFLDENLYDGYLWFSSASPPPKLVLAVPE